MKRLTTTCLASIIYLLAFQAHAGTYNVNLTRITENFYSISGSSTIVQTRFCYKYANRVPAVLTMTGATGSYDGKIVFSDQTSCDVKGAYAPMTSLTVGNYSVSLDYETYGFYSDWLHDVIVRTNDTCSKIGYSMAVTVELTYPGGDYIGIKTGNVYFPTTRCDLEAIYGLANLTAGSSGSSDTMAPGVPSNVKATAVSSSKININWNASSDNVGVTAYKLYVGGTFNNSFSGSITSVEHSGLAAGSTYTYQVSACDTAGNCSAMSSPVSATTLPNTDTTPPSVPSGVTATAISSSRIDISWNASTDNIGVSSYKVYVDGVLNNTFSASTTSINHNGLQAGTPYSYQVSACDALNNCSALSPAAKATTAGNTSSSVTCAVTPVYRYRNTQILGHFYTTSTNEGASLISSGAPLQYEGVAFNACSGGTTSNGIYPVYRFKSLTQNGVYFYSMLPSELENVRANLTNILKEEGIAYYAYSDAKAGRSPVYRFRNVGVPGANFYTMLESEKTIVIDSVPGYPYEGIGFYALQP